MGIVELKDVSRVYRNGDHEQRALDHVDLSLEEGKFIVVLGPSGAGKSTLLNLLGGLDSPTEGTITVDGRDISTLTENELADYRAETVGFVFQSYNLIPTLTVIENVALVKEIAKNPLSSHDMLREVGLADHTGFDLLGGYSLLCHYTNRDEQRTERSRKYLLELSETKPVYAIPEEDTIYVENVDKHHIVKSKK